VAFGRRLGGLQTFVRRVCRPGRASTCRRYAHLTFVPSRWHELLEKSVCDLRLARVRWKRAVRVQYLTFHRPRERLLWLVHLEMHSAQLPVKVKLPVRHTKGVLNRGAKYCRTTPCCSGHYGTTEATADRMFAGQDLAGEQDEESLCVETFWRSSRRSWPEPRETALGR
jgi:hypothetical protein